MTRRRFPLRFEPLESRHAPAVLVAAGGHSAAYTDVDGDKVTIAVSTGTLTAGLFTTVASGVGEQLQKIDFSAGGFGTANLTVSVARVAGGDGLANVGYINSTNHNLGAVAVKGDLGRIDAGDGTTTMPGLKSLAVRSLGRLGLDTQGGGGSLESDITGALGALAVAGDVKDAFVKVNGTAGAITIGGSLIGGPNSENGSILSLGDMGLVKIGHDVQGGAGNSSGQIYSFGKLAGVSVGGSLVGGPGGNCGAILSVGDMGVVKIRHDFTGGSITGSASLNGSGGIESFVGRIAGVSIGGSIISGIDTSSGTLTFNASIRAANDIGSLTVTGSLVGNVTASGASPVVISARGQAVPGATTDLAIGKIRIGGRVEFANILAGYDTGLAAVNGDAQIGKVTIGGDWVASNLVAGVMNLGADNAVGGSGANADNVNYGDSHDFSIGAGSTNITAKIASVTIKGQVFGTPNSASVADHYGFVAQQIGTLKIGGASIVLAVGPHNDNLNVGESSDTTVDEV